uniref:receptor protein-tyrosine kinase n=1 Tax=Anopheles melas TaxID=34690 RepID=A0A182TM38_9DIPT
MSRMVRDAIEAGGNGQRSISTTTVSANTTTTTTASDTTTDDGDPRCTNVDIRNDLRRLKQIENCTVINGFLQMVLIERVPSEEFEKYSCKHLREVTGYMLFFRVINLVTLRRLFPQLAVIRGQQLIGNYALVFYYMENMIELGLKNLVAIQRGFVYTLHCPQLCHLDTIDWAAISGLENGTKSQNSFEPPKSVCNNSTVCRACVPTYCWGSESCQKFYNGYNFNGRIKCHPQCLGGCTGTSATECKVCRGWKEGKRCVEQCSADRLLYRPTKRCITKETCLERSGLLYQNECVLECPAGYSTTNVDQEQADFSDHKCYPCLYRCPKVCDGTEIMYLADADRMRGCTIVNGTLHIRLKEDHPNLVDELRNGLSDVEEIMGNLKVFRSTFIPSLEFLANLQIIHGVDVNENAKFSLMVYENSNLQRLWNFEQKTNLRLDNGGMYFANNKLLCGAQIKLLRRVTDYNNASDTIDWSSNGYMQACNVQTFHVRASVLSSRNATLYWRNEPNIKTHHRLTGYLVHCIRTEVDRSPYEDRELCSKFGWKSRLVPLEGVSIEGSYYAYRLTRLKPYTRYGCYVQTYYNESVNNATDPVGMSDMVYFRTAKDRPTSPLRVHTARKNESAITLAWAILASEQGMVSLYQVDVFLQPDEVAKFDRRNYCTHPHQTRSVHSEQAPGEGSCTRDTCWGCDQLEYEQELEEEEEEDEEEEDEDEELTTPDDFFAEHTSSEDGGRIGGRRRRKRSNERPGRRWVEDDFEANMLKLLKVADAHEDHYAWRTRRDAATEIEFVNRLFYHTFTTDNYEYTVAGLSPFTRYVFQLFACSENDAVYCSSYSLYSDRTNPAPYVDRVNVSVEMKEQEMAPTGPELVAPKNHSSEEGNTTATVTTTTTPPVSIVKTTYGDRIVLYFPEPTEVNGLTVAYRVEREVINGTYLKRHTDCFTRLEHERNQYRYTIQGVTPGEYLLRVQAISLAGAGPFSEWMLVRVLEPLPRKTVGSGKGLRDGLIALLVLLLLGGGGALAFYLCRRRRRTFRRDDKIPLAANDGNEINLDDGFVNCPLK